MSKPELKILEDGTKIWWLDDDNALHREGGPAVIHPDGVKEWWVNGYRHRENGPAIVWPDGRKAWWLNGEYISLSDYKAWFINKISNPSYKLTDGDISFIKEYLE